MQFSTMEQNWDALRTEVISLFEDVRSAFPALTMDLRLTHPQVDLFLEVPKQAGLGFHVTMNLQRDELHLNAGPFWLEWFPCTDPAVVASFRDAVMGLLSGRYRILESTIAGRPVRARLQRPEGGRWQTIGTWSDLGVLIPWRRNTRVLQNNAHGTAD